MYAVRWRQVLATGECLDLQDRKVLPSSTEDGFEFLACKLIAACMQPGAATYHGTSSLSYALHVAACVQRRLLTPTWLLLCRVACSMAAVGFCIWVFTT